MVFRVFTGLSSVVNFHLALVDPLDLSRLAMAPS